MTAGSGNEYLCLIGKALINNLKYHRNEILFTLEKEISPGKWPEVRRKVLDHLGSRGIEGQIKELLPNKEGGAL